VSTRKIAVVPNGIPELDGDGIVPPPPRLGRPNVVTIGRIAAQHIPSATAGVLAAVSDLAAVSWVGGDGRDATLEADVRRLGVHVTGWLEREEVLAMLRSASVCLHWTAWDGQPLSVLEAMANDVVVVARDIPATREILGPAQVCGSEVEAVRLIRLILRRPELRDELLATQRLRRVEYGSRRMEAGWRQAYKRILPMSELRSGAAHGSHLAPRSNSYAYAPGSAPSRRP
jgi:glycosyltransferase involved in cell wall biosynthesis